jgi:hypothetical protein
VLELAILGPLKEQPLHGYELKKRLGDTLGSLSGVSYGSLYPALRRLERAGAIEIVAHGIGGAGVRVRAHAGDGLDRRRDGGGEMVGGVRPERVTLGMGRRQSTQ